jgi:hypothetical protein
VTRTLSLHRDSKIKDPAIALVLLRNGTVAAAGYFSGIIALWDVSTGNLLGYLFDAGASMTDGIAFRSVDAATGITLTYTLPYGSPIPPGATCICNCVPGTYHPPIVRLTPPRFIPPTFFLVPSYGGFGGFGGFSGGTICTCNKICTCMAV